MPACAAAMHMHPLHAPCRGCRQACCSACPSLLAHTPHPPVPPALAPITRFPQELKLLPEGANVYKMIGPALVRQDTLEAQSNVSKRLEFIGGEWVREGGWPRSSFKRRHISRFRQAEAPGQPAPHLPYSDHLFPPCL